ncbi:MAG: hypothetical protein QM783_12865 [Phycisphaerales bacterium]
MPRGVRRLLRASISIVVVAVVLLIACAVLPAHVPAGWRPRAPSVFSEFEPYKDAQGKVVYLTLRVSTIAVGEQIESGLQTTVRFFDRPTHVSAGPEAQSREQAQTALVQTFCRQHIDDGTGDGAELLRSASGAPGGSVVVHIRSRQLIAALLAAEPYVSSAAELSIGTAVPLLIYALYCMRLQRRRALAEACPRCGYSLQGLRDGAPCPECNLDAAAFRTNATRSAGLRRVILGWVTIAAAAALAGVYAYTFQPRDWPIEVASVRGMSSDQWSVGFLMGGVYLRNDRSAAVLSSPPAPTVPPWAPDVRSTRCWTAAWSSHLPLQTFRWFALWPPALVLCCAARGFFWRGRTINHDSHSSADATGSLASPNLTVGQFLFRWGALTAVLWAAFALPLLSSRSELHIRDFARDGKGVLFGSYDYGNGGAEAKLTRTVRNSPLLLLTRDTLLWFPQPPRRDEVTGAIGRDPSIVIDDVLTADDIARAPGTRYSVRVQAGAVVAPVCAILLVYPISAALSRIARRRLGKSPEPTPPGRHP